MSILIKDFMSTPVITCTIDAEVGRVRDIMKLKGFSALPVVEVESDVPNIKGIVTYRDIAGVYDDNVSVKQIMTEKVRVVQADTTARKSAEIMQQSGIHHLVVIDDNRIVGMASAADFVGLVATHTLV